MRKIEPPIGKLISDNTIDILGEISAAEFTTKVAVNLLTKTTCSVEEIAALLEVPLDFVSEVKKRLRIK